VIHERQPLFVLQSDNTIQNKFELKILNKTDNDEKVKLTVVGPEGLKVKGVDEILDIKSAKVTPYTVFLTVPKNNLKSAREPVTFHVEMIGQEAEVKYESMFFGPK
jgi:uncharacterized membrane protein